MVLGEPHKKVCAKANLLLFLPASQGSTSRCFLPTLVAFLSTSSKVEWPLPCAEIGVVPLILIYL